MHTADHERIAGVAAKKWSYFERSPGGYLILSALAGIYLGFGMALIFSVGGPSGCGRFSGRQTRSWACRSGSR
jgi:nitrite transporter NirC